MIGSDMNELAGHAMRPRRAAWGRGLTLAGVALLAFLALYLVLSDPLAPQVTLRTYADLPPGTTTGCFLGNTTGLLIVDPAAGTAIVSEDMAKTTVAVIWPTGYTGRRTLTGQVDVLDRDGHVVATTGNRYELLGGYTGDPSAWLSCGGEGVYPPTS